LNCTRLKRRIAKGGGGVRGTRYFFVMGGRGGGCRKFTVLKVARLRPIVFPVTLGFRQGRTLENEEDKVD
jgi:hypothetical protein